MVDPSLLARYTDTLTDQNFVPLNGAQITVSNSDGTAATLYDALGNPLPNANPFFTGPFGTIDFYAMPAVYGLRYTYGGRVVRDDEQIVGSPPEFRGAPGLPNNTYTSYSALLASDPTRQYAYLVGDTDSPPRPDGVFSNPTKAAGAWVPQGATGIAFKQSGNGAAQTTVAAAVSEIGITPNHFGITFAGGDDTAKLQAMIDAAHQYRRPILFNGGVVYITSPLSLIGRNVTILGASAAQTAIVAAAPMPVMIDARETSDVIFSPYEISGIKLDGGSKAQVGIATRYRHESKLTAMSFNNFTDVCIREKDAWNNMRERLLLADSPNCLDLQGANNNCIWSKCTFTGASGVHINFGSAGSAGIGSFATLFEACDLEYGADGGKGIVIADGASVKWVSGYLGEDIRNTIIENSGHFSLSGGTLFFDRTPASTGVVPLKGSVQIRDMEIRAEGSRGVNNLIGVPDSALSGSYGRVAIHNSPYSGSVGGTPLLNGDVLNYGPAGIVFAPRLGRSWNAESSGVSITDTVVGNGRRVTCNALTSGSPVMGVGATMTLNDLRQGEMLCLIVVYSSSKQLTFRVAGSPLGAALASLGTLPATGGLVRTAVQLNIAAPALTGTPTIEMYIDGTAALGDVVTLYEAFIADSRQIDATAGTFGNLFKC